MIHLATLEEFFDHEEDTLHDFITIVIHDWQSVRTGLLQALQARSLKDFRFHAHRMKSMINLLQATRLQQSILSLKAHLMENPTEDFTDKQAELFAAMQEAIEILERRIQV